MALFYDYTDDDWYNLLTYMDASYFSHPIKHIRNNRIEYTFSTHIDSYVVAFEQYLDGYQMFFCLDDGNYDINQTTNYHSKNYYEYLNVFNTILKIMEDFSNNIVYFLFNENRLKLKTICEQILQEKIPNFIKRYNISYEVKDSEIKITIGSYEK